MNWDEVRYFLAVAREGSVRAAADRLGVNHTTVLRRIAQLEHELGAIVFEKMPSGYRLTPAGEEVVPLAEEMEAASSRLQARVFGRDQEARGKLRVTMPAVVASHLLMPDLVAFARRHPELEMEILSLEDPVNLTNREADVAVRAVYDRDALPPNLHGVKGPEVAMGVYVSRDLLTTWRAGEGRRSAGSSKTATGIRTGRSRAICRRPTSCSGRPMRARRSPQSDRGLG